jgi:hypothetical protein
LEEAREKVDILLSEHEPLLLPLEIERELMNIEQKARIYE